MRLLIVIIMLYQGSALAKDIDFSLGAGAPYFVVAEISMPVSENFNLFSNYKLGLDSGYSIGIKKSFVNKHHILGVYIGAVGTKRPDCNKNRNDSDFDDAVNSAVECAFGLISQKTLNGLGFSYDFAFQGMNNSGFAIRLDVGSGTNSYIDGYKTTSGITALYNF